MMPKISRHHIILIAHSMAVVCVLLCFVVTSSAAPSNTVTFRIPKKDVSKLSNISVLSRVDYDGFSLIEIPSSASAKLKNAVPGADEYCNDTNIGLLEHRFDTRTGPPAVASSMKAIEKAGTPTLYLVQFKGPIKSEWLEQIQSFGAKIVGYIPQNAYLVWADLTCMNAIGQKSCVRWKGPYHPSYKVANVFDRLQGNIKISVQIYGDKPDNTINEIESFGATLVSKSVTPFSQDAPGTTAWFCADVSIVQKIARIPQVVRIDKANINPSVDDEVACQTVVNHTLNNIPYASPSYKSWLDQTGFDGTGSRVAIVDTGCDTNDNATAHPDLRGRLTVIKYSFTSDQYGDPTGHGTHVAGIVAGNASLGTKDTNGFLYGQGVAPGANLLIQNAIAGPFPPDGDWETITRDAVRNQAFVSNNSWAWDLTPGIGYTLVCRVFDLLARDADTGTDGNQQLSLVFSVGNVGPEPQTINDPKEAKNIISVGATQNYRPSAPLPSTCGPYNNIDGMASFSSRGPCRDGRIAPTLVAPGTGIASAVSYDAIGMGAYHDPLVPCKALATADYAWMSGTSQAAPMVSGALAIVGQWWRSAHSGVNPSPAMCKAILVNSADDIAGGPDGRGGTLQHIPNGDQGWGRLDIAAAVNPPDTCYDDQTYLFTATGQSKRYRIDTVDPGKPLKITLAWTDAPGIPACDAWVNDLDLTATSGATVYHGNYFSDGWSIAGGSSDCKNNVECIYIEHPSGSYWITVTASNIAGDGVPGNGYPLDQDYAIVLRNAYVGGELLQPYQTVSQSTAAEPDYYRALVPSSGWFAIGVKPSVLNDSDLSLFTDPGYATQVAVSNLRGSGLDFVAVDGNRSLGPLVYSLVNNFAGSSGYQIELATKISDLATGIPSGAAFSSSDLMKMWDVSTTGATNCAIRVQPNGGQLDLGISVFGSTLGISNTYYKNRTQRLAEVDTNGIGQAETLYFTTPAAGKYGVVIWNKNGPGDFGISFDDDPPTTPVITNDSSYTTNFTQLVANWLATDPETGIAKYEYCIGTAPGQSDFVPWTYAGNCTRMVARNLSLVSGKSYYFTVRATNGLGMTSLATGAPVLAVQSADTAADVKELPDGAGVVITSKEGSAAFAGRFYISENDHSSAIGVIWPSTITEGRLFTIVGTLTTENGERFIRATEVHDLGPAQ